jgi:ParB-like chromosome segregation protein Spo0J
VDKKRVLLAGYGRLQAATNLGLDRLPVIVIPLVGNKAREYLIADNSIPDLAKWEKKVLKLELQELRLDFDIGDLGFDESFLNKYGVGKNSEGPQKPKYKHKCPSCRCEA